MVFIDDTTLLRQLSDPKNGKSLEEMSTDELRAYYLLIERRMVGALLALTEYNRHPFWALYDGKNEVERACDALYGRWAAVTRSMDLFDAHALACSATTRREAIRQEVREKLTAKANTSTEGTPIGNTEVEQGQA